jgi:ribosomal-protein-alanine N-acetyltransferase
MLQNNFNISIMKIEDLENIKDTLEIDFDDFWNYNIFKSELENPNSIYFVAKEDNEIVGFIGLLIVFEEADITNIVVKKSFRGKRYF